MPAKLSTTVGNIDTKVKNQVNRELIKEFYIYLKNLNTSDNYHNGLLKVIIRYAEYAFTFNFLFELYLGLRLFFIYIMILKRALK